MRFKLEYPFELDDEHLLININDGRVKEYTNINEVPEEEICNLLYKYYLEGIAEFMDYTQIKIKKV